MKTIGRILIILAVFALVMRITYRIVNARGSSGAGVPPRFEQANGRLASPGGAPLGFPNVKGLNSTARAVAASGCLERSGVSRSSASPSH